MRTRVVLQCLLLLSASAAAPAQVSIGISLPRVSIGIDVPVYPELVAVPGYPVYYASGMEANYFFYDGLFWVYEGDRWYSSAWYNGPWDGRDPLDVPRYILQVPVQYYRAPPRDFGGWRADAPPRWADHWGQAWAQRRSGWDQPRRGPVPEAAPLPGYQRDYAGARYPPPAQQQVLQVQNYSYRPHGSGPARNPSGGAGSPAHAAPAAAPLRHSPPLPAESPPARQSSRPGVSTEGRPPELRTGSTPSGASAGMPPARPEPPQSRPVHAQAPQAQHAAPAQEPHGEDHSHDH